MRGALSVTQLLKILGLKDKVCVVGFDLSREACAPHFTDIQKGVWSSASSKLNPVLSEYGYQTVRNWFQWRTRTMGKFIDPSVFQSLAKFQETCQLKVITQCVDGLAGLHGVQDVLEPYGNIFGRKCYMCGNTLTPLASGHGEDESWLPCEKCGGTVFPDVTMFGWNSKEESHQMVRTAIETAKVLIIVGTDQYLMPFYGSTAHTPPACPVLEITQTGFSLRMQSNVFKATAIEIAKELESAYGGNRIKAPDTPGLAKNLLFLANTKESAMC